MSWKNPFVILTYKWNSVLEGKVLMCSQKVLHHHERCFVGDEVFWSLKDFWRMKLKDLFFFRYNESFLLKNISFTLATEFVHRTKKNCIHNSMLLWKTDVKMTVKDDKIIYSKVKSYFRRLLRTLHFWENEEISKVLYFFLFGEMKLVETLSLLIDIKLKQISNAQKKN